MIFFVGKIDILNKKIKLNLWILQDQQWYFNNWMILKEVWLIAIKVKYLKHLLNQSNKK